MINNYSVVLIDSMLQSTTSYSVASTSKKISILTFVSLPSLCRLIAVPLKSIWSWNTCDSEKEREKIKSLIFMRLIKDQSKLSPDV